MLIHSHHGFFVWTPGMLAASLGLVLALDESLVDWHGSDSFGSRRFDVARPFRLALFPEACVRLPLAGPADLSAVLTARAPAALAPRTMTIAVNGRAVATRQLGPEWRDIPFTLPAEELTSGENSVCFRFARRLPGEDGVAAGVARLELP